MDDVYKYVYESTHNCVKDHIYLLRAYELFLQLNIDKIFFDTFFVFSF